MIISVCSRCKPLKEGLCRQKFVIDELKAGLAIDVQVQEVRCLAACDQPISVGISELGKASYLFGDITSQEHVLALVEFVGQYQKKAKMAGPTQTNAPRLCDRKQLQGFQEVFYKIPKIVL
jgi:predicted metal-binding protein